VPYDGDLTQAEGKNQWWEGFDPQRLYGPKHPFDALPDISYVKNFYDRTLDLIDQHDPDLLYFDNSLLPLGWGGMNIGAYFYNHNLKTRGGKMEAILNVKQVPDHLAKALVADYERGLTSQIMPYAWQSATCIGDWHYKRSLFDQPGEYGGYLPPRDVIHWLIDTVSKNGTFILNLPGKPDGTIDSKEIAILDQIAAWMKVNGEAIYETRPWKIYGEGPDMVKSGEMEGTSVNKLGVRDIRFTRNKAQYCCVRDRPGLAGGRLRGQGTRQRKCDPTRKNRKRPGTGHRREAQVEPKQRRLACGAAEPLSPQQRLCSGAENILVIRRLSVEEQSTISGQLGSGNQRGS
jgi:alpha-L-fucosidase